LSTKGFIAPKDLAETAQLVLQVALPHNRSTTQSFHWWE
jgi:hypothetical protein